MALGELGASTRTCADIVFAEIAPIRPTRAGRGVGFCSDCLEHERATWKWRPEAVASGQARARQGRGRDPFGHARIVFQPTYGLEDDTMVGVECLARFDLEPRRSPDIWFNGAHAARVGLELDLHAIENALIALDLFPRSVFLRITARRS